MIPALLALIQRLAVANDVQVFALNQETAAGEWDLLGARIHNIGVDYTRLRAISAIHKLHRTARFDVVHAIWSGACGLIAVAVGKALSIPSLVHIAGGELVSMPEIGYGGMQTLRGRARERLVLRGASCVTAASAPVLGALSSLGLIAQRVPLGVDLKTWPPRRPVRRQDGRPAMLIHVASLNRVKDQATLLRALASLKESRLDFEMDIVGEDTLHGEIQDMAGELGLSRAIRFRGFLPHRQLRPLVEQADLLIHSSRHEAGPLVMLEAAVAGIPTVGTAVGHIAEWAPDAAVSVPVGDWSGLAGAIARLLLDDPMRVDIATQAMRRASREDADYTAERFHALYRGLI
ncbi:MAG TPA: glycosyltransferase family 4 protein [Steroidobacteraceae bacterium]|nr:glycosyltransferase family 4 protein [Steroidobacteraceae bacterium]